MRRRRAERTRCQESLLHLSDMMVVFDTSLMVDASRKRKYALDLIASYSEKEQIATTIITKYEMLRGAPEHFIDLVSDLLKRFLIFDFGNDALDETIKVYTD